MIGNFSIFYINLKFYSKNSLIYIFFNDITKICSKNFIFIIENKDCFYSCIQYYSPYKYVSKYMDSFN